MSGMSHAGRPRWGSGRAVSWYALDSEGVEAVARFVAHGWSEGDGALIIASAHHRARIEAAMVQLGADPELMLDQGRYVARDADETLRQIVDRRRPATPSSSVLSWANCSRRLAETVRTCVSSAS